ncbi:unnamed protein product [Citrullus colocynthis]|uniref:Uncharacterized protein n=1 Tax=Citrullus colocynthis TaxID=252529 RepID=A0ABP0Y5Z1_9ROSI
MIPEGFNKKGWMTFHNMLTFKEQVRDQVNNTSRYHHRAETLDTKRRTYADIISPVDSSSYESDSSKPSIASNISTPNNKANWSYKTDVEDQFDWEKMIVLTHRYFHYD